MDKSDCFRGNGTVVLKKAVEYVLERSQDCRDDDNRLILAVFTEFYDVNTLGTKALIGLEDLSRIPNAENIVRVRAYLQNDRGCFPASPDVRFRRMNHTHKVKEEMLGYPPVKIVG